MKIRQANLKDLSQIAEIFDKYRQFYNKSSDLPSAIQFLKSRIENSESILFGAFEGEKVIGFAQLYPCFSSMAMRSSYILNDLYVEPDHRRKSVALALLKVVKEFARQKQTKSLTLKTEKTNLQAQALYLKDGWQVDEKFVSYNFVFDI